MKHVPQNPEITVMDSEILEDTEEVAVGMTVVAAVVAEKVAEVVEVVAEEGAPVIGISEIAGLDCRVEPCEGL
jgi:acetyl-CoA carboxylase carboxyltransferase component